jgi:hypothetical protein
VIGHRPAKSFPAPGRIELLSPDHGLQPGHERLHISEDTFSSYGTFVASPAADQKYISKHFTEPIESPTHGRLTEKAPFGGARHMLFLQKGLERVE